jgi:protein ImuB
MAVSMGQSNRRRCLALWFPLFAAERAQRGQEQTQQQSPAPPEPFALVMRSGSALRLAAVDAGALRAGLAPGMTLADARARCPGLVTHPHVPQDDARELARLAAAMIRFTPLVSADPPDGLVLDVAGCAHLAGGEGALAAAAMTLAGYSARHAFADNAAAARALARYGAVGAEDVGALPVAALELSPAALAGLRRAGLATVGDLARRPAASLAARFGEAAVLRLRQLTGEAASPLVPLRSAAPVRARIAFAEPVARTEDVLDVAEELLCQTGAVLEVHQLGGRRFILALERSDGAKRRLTVETGRPTRDPAPVLRLLCERIETLADPLDPGFGFDAIALAVERTEPLAARQVALGSAAGDGQDSLDSLAALLDRLAVRLGSARVWRLASADRHLPEVAQLAVPAAAHTAAAPAFAPSREAPLRPLCLFDPPQPIEVIAGVPDGPPQRFRWRRQLREVRLAEGPERIAAEWWRRRGGHRGAGGLTRDYYRIEDAAGRRYWVFRNGLFAEKGDPRWYLHGLFA